MPDNNSRTIHALHTGLSIPAVNAAGDAVAGRVLLQGETVTLDAAAVEATRDRIGRSFLDLTAAEQIEKWGRQMFAAGPAPEGVKVGADDESRQYRLGTQAREHAKQISDPDDRAAALKEVAAEYGKALHPVAQAAQFVPGS